MAEPLAGKGRLVAADRGAVRRDARALRDARRRRRPLRPRGRGRRERARDPGRAVRLRAARRRSACSSGRRSSRSTTATTCSRSSAAGGSGGSARKRIVLATGALERPPVFADNDRPGLMLAGAAAAYGNPDGVTPVTRRLEPARPPLEPGARPPPLGRPHRRAGARRRARRGRGRRPRHRRRPARRAAVRAPDGDEDAAFVDLERDATVADIRRAVGAGLRSVEHVKRFTTIGTGSDQGKTANVNAIRVAAELLGVAPRRARHDDLPAAVHAGLVRARSPAATAARCSTRSATTPIHAWHVAHGAVFENVGQWKRPALLPARRRDMDDAVLRECRAAREGVGDAWTLDARQDRRPGPGRGRVPEPHVHERVRLARRRPCRYG